MSQTTSGQYRSLLGQGTEDIKTAVVRFPKPIGPHAYGIGDTVVFLYRGHGITGTINRFDRAERKTYATVETEAEGLIMENISKLLFEGHPDFVARAKPIPHLPEGGVVRVSGLPKGKSYAGIGEGDLAVVMADKGHLVNLVKLGGWAGRGAYARLTHDVLTLVTIDPRTGAITE